MVEGPRVLVQAGTSKKSEEERSGVSVQLIVSQTISEEILAEFEHFRD
jgi:hypothetical protein